MGGDIRNGWGWPANSRKAHYFADKMSLCRKWMFSGHLDRDNGKRGPDDCAACARALPNLQRCQACGSEESSKKSTWCRCNEKAPHRRVLVSVIESVDAVLG